MRWFFLGLIFVGGCINKKQGDKNFGQSQALPIDSVQVIQRYQERGKLIVQATGKALISALTEAIREKGIPGAIGYCHLQAIPITDSVARVHGVQIKRTSHKIRNPHNAPDSLEQKLLQTYLALSQKDTTFVIVAGDRVHFFAPIRIQPLCLNCHGIPEKDIVPEVFTTLRRVYPTDSATGFQLGELRGIWHVTFEKQTQ